MNPLDHLPLLAVMALATLTQVLFIEFGFRYGTTKKGGQGKAQMAQVRAIMGASLGLLAFMLAFSFSMAQQHFEERTRAYMLEVSAIGAAFRGADLIPVEARGEAKEILLNFAKLRLELSKVVKKSDMEAVVEMIRCHHTIQDADGEPIMARGNVLSESARVLISVNVFLGEIRRRSVGQNFETMKNLTFLADSGLIDAKAIRILAKLYLPKLKAFVLEKACKLAGECLIPGSTPILWPISGDKMPAVFLCHSDDCEHRTDQLIGIALTSHV